MKQLITRTYVIDEIYLSGLYEKVEKLNRKAIKLHCLPITVEVKSESFRRDRNYNVIKEVEIDITHELIYIDGYLVIGKITHENTGNIVVNFYNDIKIPQKYMKSESKCDHCNINRYRKVTYILQKMNTSDIIQVGRTCLKDFTNNEEIENYISLLDKVYDIMDDLDDTTPEGKYYVETDTYLEIAKRIIYDKGYISRSNAKDRGVKSTSDIALEVYKKREDKIVISEEVKNAIEWISTVRNEKDSEYINNMQVICKSEYFEERYIGYVCSLINAYRRNIESNTKNTRNELSKHVGDIKEKMEMYFYIQKIIPVPSYYGTIYIHSMLDENNNVIVYKGSKYLTENIDGTMISKIYVKFTVKEHIVYNGVNQTIIERPKVISK